MTGEGQVCAICYFMRSTDRRTAETTINGQAVCDEHIDSVQGGSHAVALNLARAREVGKAVRDDTED